MNIISTIYIELNNLTKSVQGKTYILLIITISLIMGLLTYISYMNDYSRYITEPTAEEVLQWIAEAEEKLKHAQSEDEISAIKSALDSMRSMLVENEREELQYQYDKLTQGIAYFKENQANYKNWYLTILDFELERDIVSLKLQEEYTPKKEILLRLETDIKSVSYALGQGMVSQDEYNLAIKEYTLKLEVAEFSITDGRNAWAYTMRMLTNLTSFAIPLFIVFVANSLYLGGLNDGSLNLILIRPIKRKWLYLLRIFTITIITVLILILVTPLFIALGGYTTTLAGLTEKSIVGIKYYDYTIQYSDAYLLTVWEILAYYYSSMFITLLFYISLAVFMTIILKNKFLVILVYVIILYLPNLTRGIKASIFRWTPIPHLQSFFNFNEFTSKYISGISLPESMTILTFYSVLLIIAGMVMFEKWEII